MKATPSITGVAEIVLNVRDLGKMRDFYRDVLGFQLLSEACHETGPEPDAGGKPTIAFLTTKPVDTESPGLRNPSRKLRSSQRAARSPPSQPSRGRVSRHERTGPLFQRPGAQSFGAYLPCWGDYRLGKIRHHP